MAKPKRSAKSVKLHQREEPEKLQALNISQGQYMAGIQSNTVTFGLGSAGTGKAQPLSSKVLTPSGWVEMGNLAKGDLVSCPDGTQAEILGVFPQGKKDIVELTFEDGRKTKCCRDHLWKVYQYAWRPENTRWRVIDTNMLIGQMNQKSSSKRLYVPLPEPIGTKEDLDLPVDPYLLGFLLGDGSLTVNVGFTTADPEVVEILKGRVGEGLQINKTPSADYAYNIVSPLGYSNPLKGALKDLGVFSHKSYSKFIPKQYLEEISVDQKWELLQGLMDSDGTADKSGSASFCTVSEELAKGVQYLVRSLGGLCKISTKETKYTVTSGEVKSGAMAYNLNIRVKTPKKLFKLSRKLERVSNEGQYAESLKLRVTSVKEVESEEAQCIMVAHPDRLYITDNFIVTHNTYCAVAMAGEYLYQGLVDKVVVTRPAVESGRGLGYLKGDLEEKFAPYIKPVKAILVERFGKGWYESQIKNENILIEPLEYLQGQTFDNAFILLDEAENATEKELYILLTRIGVNSKIVLNGDIKQSFVRDSGLESCMNRIGKLDDVFIHQFTSDDVVRSDIVRNIIKAYES